MSATGLDVFDKTLHITNTWLGEIMEVLGPDRQIAWHALGAVLRTLRDRMPLELAVHLGTQLPILVRGTYYEQWQPEKQPDKTRTVDEWLQHVNEKLVNIRPVDAQDATKAVFHVLSRHVDTGQITKIRDALPTEVRRLWPDSFLGEGPRRQPAAESPRAAAGQRR